METIKKKLRSFLMLEEAQQNVIRITESLTFADNCTKNTIWYRGDGHELEQLYQSLPFPAARLSFWGARATHGMEIRKIHTGVPGLMIDILTAITMADLNDIEIDKLSLGDLWCDIAKDNSFPDVLSEAVKDALSLGDGAFKISFDPQVSGLPIIEWVPGNLTEFVYRRGRLHEVQFKTHFIEARKSYTLLERCGYGYLRNELYCGDNPVDMSTTEFTRGLSDFDFDDSVILGIPFKIYASGRWTNRGRSIFDRKTDAFDSLDEAWSQWMDALRSGRTKEYIPDCFIPRDPNSGVVMSPNAFDNRFIITSSDLREGAKNGISLQQPAIPHDSYLASYITALDLALQGIISPSTLGIDVKKMDNAEAQREKEKATLYTRNAIVQAMESTIPKVVEMAINAYNVMLKRPIEDIEVIVPFGEYANPSFESQIETVGKGKTQGILSIEASVEELYGDTRDEEWKREEVARLKAEQGITDTEEPAVNTELGGFEANVSDNSEQSIRDVEGRGGTAVKGSPAVG